MYSKFKVDIENYTFSPVLYDTGKIILTSHKNTVKSKLDRFVDYDTGIINGDLLEKELFKEIKADVFLSHSHSDERLAVTFAGWLKTYFNLTAFVDSCVWEYANDILEEINNRYNLIRKESDGSKTYSHNKANYAASHVYLMLNSALNNMINKTECFMFIDTKQSCFYMDKDKASGKTLSPWIYSEIVMANTMKTSDLKRAYQLTEFAHSEIRNQLQISHNLDFSTFVDLDSSDLDIWKKNKKDNVHPLDTLYYIKAKGNTLNG